MALVTSKELLLDAQKNGYGVGAFNVENMEMVQAVVAAAEELRAPVILQTTPGTLKYADAEYFFANVRTAAGKASVPVVLHLDHGNSFEMAMRAFRAGYTSIMIDGSKLSFEENIALSRITADVCHAAGIPVEAELGKVGGKEDDLVVTGDSPYTDPEEAAEFVRRTGIDSLAVGIGTAHGFYKGEPHVDLDLLCRVREAVDIPLVLHGTSGVPDETVAQAVKRGICKVNYATELRAAFSDGVKAVLTADPEVYDPKKYNQAGRERVKELVKKRIVNLGSADAGR